MVDGETALRTLLVVDDDTVVREIVAERLEGSGYSVLQAAGGEDALRIVNDRSDVDLIITDVRMPGMSGVELMRRVASLGASVKVILMSGYFEPQKIEARFLKKPFSMTELDSAVRDELHGRA
jgi:CheY-like chemotaxis protein